MHVAKVRTLAQGAIGLTLPADMIHKYGIGEGKVIIRPLPNGSFNFMFFLEEDFNDGLKKMGGLN